MGETYLVHGREWKTHKYIRKEGNRYIYEEPKRKSKGRSIKVTGTGKSIYRRGDGLGKGPVGQTNFSGGFNPPKKLPQKSLDSFISALGNAYNSVSNAVSSAASNAFDTVTEYASNTVNAVSNKIDEAQKHKEYGQKLREAVGEVLNQDLINAVFSGCEFFGMNFPNDIGTVIDDAYLFGFYDKQMGDTLYNVFSQLQEKDPKEFKKLFSDLAKKVDHAYNEKDYTHLEGAGNYFDLLDSHNIDYPKLTDESDYPVIYKGKAKHSEWYGTNGSYLMHHGIKGQKWGVQNGPPYPLDASDKSPAERKKIARVAQGSLNKLDKKDARNRYEVYSARERVKQLEDKKQRAKTDEKAERIQQKIDKTKAKADPYEKAMKENAEKAKAFINSLKDQGFDVNSTFVLRDATKAKEFILGVATGLLITKSVGGLQYKVKDARKLKQE